MVLLLRQDLLVDFVQRAVLHEGDKLTQRLIDQLQFLRLHQLLDVGDRLLLLNGLVEVVEHFVRG